MSAAARPLTSTMPDAAAKEAGVGSLPGTAATCTTAAELRLGCANAACPSGTTYSSSAASQCLSDVNNESCTDINNSVTPASCSSPCH